MISRREVIASGIAVTLLGQHAALASSGAAHVSAGRRLFLTDERFPAAAQAALAAEANRSEIIAHTADITSSYDRLDLALRNGPATVAGLTTAQALFALERLGWDRGLRTVFRGWHGRTPALREHRLHGSKRLISQLNDAFAESKDDWAAALGRTLAVTAPAHADRADILTTQWLPADGNEALVSWLLVPRQALMSPVDPSDAPA